MPSEITFTDGFAADYSFAVPECFREALSKGQFSAGDVFYDHRSAYQKKWGEALSDISLSLQVNASLGGQVHFSILRPDAAKSRILRVAEQTVSSEEFREILKRGLKEKCT
jgi:hypothetical protein